jgi:ferric-dicitrate binding protein FerR (iron transport regulator)
MEEENIYSLITKYFNHDCNEDEIRTILDWCEQSETNKREFIQLKKIWVVSDKQTDEKIRSAAPHIWNNIISNISIKAPKKYTKRTLIYIASISAAAAVILMLCLNVFTNQNYREKEIEYADIYMPKGEKGQLFLPDGTKVWLNSGSKLTFGNDFNTKTRTVTLDGEAYFDVVKNDKRKFIVQTASVDVKVHGTAFNVTAYSESNNVDVSLQRGSVSIYRSGSDEELALLVPNQHISIDKKSFLSKINLFEDDHNIAWTFEELIFEHAPLEEVFSKMGNWYGVDFSVVSQPSQQNLKYRFKIKSESLTEILELINKMTPIEYKIDGKEVTVRYK